MERDPADLLRRHGLRVTPQRRAILDAFAGHAEEHLAADEVHARATAAVPELGRGTVYATLAELTELGVLAAFGSPQPVRYETNVEPHEHFRCRLCLRLWDVELPTPDTGALGRKGFKVETVAITAEGICSACSEFERGLDDGAASVRRDRLIGDEQLASLACLRREDSNVGPLVLAASPEGLIRIAFEDHADYEPCAERARTRRGGRSARDRLDHLGLSLDAYFGGDHAQAEDLIDWTGAASERSTALEGLRRIPFGTSRSYELLGDDLTPYDCGHAIGTNPFPLLLPCHRVTRGAQRTGGYVGGLDRRDALVRFESGL